jgi:hypothetical protein
MKREITAVYHEGEQIPSLNGWFWACACNACLAKKEMILHGPFKTKRRALANGKNEKAPLAPACMVTALDRRLDDAEGEWATIRIKEIRASTEEFARQISVESLFASDIGGIAH